MYRAVLFMYGQPHSTQELFSDYESAKEVVDAWVSDEFYGKVKTGHVEVAVLAWAKT